MYTWKQPLKENDINNIRYDAAIHPNNLDSGS